MIYEIQYVLSRRHAILQVIQQSKREPLLKIGTVGTEVPR